ncbi:MAG: hypothetical protein HLUCCA11_07885 [Phormidesmis priestleyi Ana]|uniref:MnmC-like methyltransferase domain-containing protein n=1 Tax=Phormidesmis priestleyi Ana TaxID=1666911 RepID=A0A0P8DHL5_9CYAN|nr:MAG: hypothetical protein HLUCCA11_07885 [Phormidesmis priestleyi Ana]
MFTPVKTKDGSSTFYSEVFGEWFHNREGACREAQQTYIETSRLAQLVQRRLEAAGHESTPDSLKILDVCYGLGYNTAAALETIWQVDQTHRLPVEIRALEIDIEVARSAIAQNLIHAYPPAVQQTLQQLAAHSSIAQPNLNAAILLGDARKQVHSLIQQHWQADIIFLDPFSPQNCPQLWTVEFLQQVAQCLSPLNGLLITYSCAAAVRISLAAAGLTLGTLSTAARKWPGTMAAHSTSCWASMLPPLTQQEQEHLQTRAAVPYRDPTLQATAEEILAHRSQEQHESNLLPTKPWRRRYTNRKQHTSQKEG